MEQSYPRTTGRLIDNPKLPARRRLLRGGLALFGLGLALRGHPLPAIDRPGDGFVIVDGWVIPARHFQD